MKSVIFRILGVVCVSGGLYAFYDFGRELLPLFTKFLQDSTDVFEVYTVLTSFFLGAVALIWTGIRLIALQSFSHSWLYAANFPLTVWLQELYGIDTVLTVGRSASSFIVYFCIYSVVLAVTIFVHTHWFMPVSHVTGRQIALEKADTPLLVELRWAILIGVILILIIANPSDALRIFNETISTIMYMVTWVRG